MFNGCEIWRKEHISQNQISIYPDIQSNYEKLTIQFKNGIEDMTETGGWYYDKKFLFHLTRVFKKTMRYFQK